MFMWEEILLNWFGLQKNKKEISLRRNIVRIVANVPSGSFVKAAARLPSSTKLEKLKGLTIKSV